MYSYTIHLNNIKILYEGEYFSSSGNIKYFSSNRRNKKYFHIIRLGRTLTRSIQISGNIWFLRCFLVVVDIPCYFVCSKDHDDTGECYFCHETQWIAPWHWQVRYLVNLLQIGYFLQLRADDECLPGPLLSIQVLSRSTTCLIARERGEKSNKISLSVILVWWWWKEFVHHFYKF